MAQVEKEVKESFVYAVGDAKKTPIDFAAQPKGTSCVLVTPNGTEYEIMAGVTRLPTALTPEKLAKVERAKNGWDSKNVAFPNLKISQEG